MPRSLAILASAVLGWNALGAYMLLVSLPPGARQARLLLAILIGICVGLAGAAIAGSHPDEDDDN